LGEQGGVGQKLNAGALSSISMKAISTVVKIFTAKPIWILSVEMRI
jgi:hypothetical protein